MAARRAPAGWACTVPTRLAPSRPTAVTELLTFANAAAFGLPADAMAITALDMRAFTGIALRHRAFPGARNELGLAAESGVSLISRGSPSPDRTVGRSATVPAVGCRARGGLLGADVPLLLRS